MIGRSEYFRRNVFNAKSKYHVRHKDIPDRLTSVLKSGEFSEMQTKIIASLFDFFTKNGCLTRQQYASLRKFEKFVLETPQRKEEQKKMISSLQGDCEYQKIVGLLNNESKNLSKWENDFLGSVRFQYERNGSLSPKQISIVNKIASNHTEQAKIERNSWFDSYDETKKVVFNACVDYYIKINKDNYTNYYSGILEKVIFARQEKKEHIPTEQEYKKICQNDHSQKITDTINSKPLFDAGELCKLRSNVGHTPLTKGISNKLGYPVLKDDIVLVLSVDTCFYSAVNGCRVYTVLPLGKKMPFQLEERNMKKMK